MLLTATDTTEERSLRSVRQHIGEPLGREQRATGSGWWSSKWQDCGDGQRAANEGTRERRLRRAKILAFLGLTMYGVPMHAVFADPKTDFVFKRIFGVEAPKPLLIALLRG